MQSFAGEQNKNNLEKNILFVSTLGKFFKEQLWIFFLVEKNVY